MLGLKKKFGKNAVLKGTNYLDGATMRERNQQIGGHKLTSISLAALWSAWAWQSTPVTKLHRRRKKLKSLKNKNTRPRRNKRGLF